jgi:hypothetical protein
LRQIKFTRRATKNLPGVLSENGSETELISRNEIFANVMPAGRGRLATSRNWGEKAMKTSEITKKEGLLAPIGRSRDSAGSRKVSMQRRTGRARINQRAQLAVTLKLACQNR